MIAPAASVGPSIPSVPAARKNICRSGNSAKCFNIHIANSWARPPETLLLICFCLKASPSCSIFSDLKLLLKLFLGSSPKEFLSASSCLASSAVCLLNTTTGSPPAITANGSRLSFFNLET